MKHLRFALPLAFALSTAAGGIAAAQQAPTPTKPAAPQPTAPVEQPEQTVEQRLTFLLSGYEYFPTREDLDNVAPADVVAAQLRAFATDPSGRPTHRIRSVDALGYYDDDETVALLTRLVQTDETDGMSRREVRTANLLRHHAITALARSKKQESVTILEPYLGDEDVQIALTTIHALAKHGGTDGVAALRAHKQRTDNKTVLRELAKWVR